MRALFVVFAALLVSCGNPAFNPGSGAGDGGTSSTPPANTNRYCYRYKVVGSGLVCECFPTVQDRSTTTWDVVATCGGNTGELCFADIRTTGHATSCGCMKAGCYQDASGYCTCMNGETLTGTLDTSTARAVPTCGSASMSTGTHCCEWTDPTDCWCSAGYCSRGGTVQEIAACTPETPRALHDNRTSVPNCTNVTY